MSTTKPHCLFPHDRVEPTPVGDERLLGLQRIIDERAETREDEDRVRARDWFVGMRSLVEDAARDADSDVLVGSDPPLYQRMTRWCDVRDEAVNSGMPLTKTLYWKVPSGPGPVLMASWLRTVMMRSRIEEW